MEEKMISIIIKTIAEYRELAQKLNEDSFLESVCKSFTDSFSERHYVAIVPVDLDDTFNEEQHRNFAKYGFHQIENESMFSNMFIACQIVVDKMIEVLREKEGMTVDRCCDPNGQVIYVVSLYGVRNTHFERDFTNNGQPDNNQITNN